MAVLKTEEIRQEEIAEGIISGKPVCKIVKCVRHITPLVMHALQQNNNPFVTGKKGFEAIGIEFNEAGEQITEPSQFGLAMMSKTAEVLILLSCTREELREYAIYPSKLEEAGLDFLEDSSMDDIAEAAGMITDQLQGVSFARATKSKEEEKPVSSSINGGGAGKSKKPNRIGSRKS